MYISFFGKDGQRITTIVEGIHFEEDNKTETVNQYLSDYEGATAVELTDEEYTEQLNKGLVLIDGHLTNPPVKEEPDEFVNTVNENRADGLLTMSNEDLKKMLLMLNERVESLEESKDESEDK